MIVKILRTPTLVDALALSIGTLGAGSISAAPAPSPTLSVTFASATINGSLPYATPYLVSGCGYAASGVTVVVHSPEAISFAGQLPDASGCIAVSNFSTQGAGHYDVDAYQQVHGTKSSQVASTSF